MSHYALVIISYHIFIYKSECEWRGVDMCPVNIKVIIDGELSFAI